ncbi:hypothetical protein ACQY0O_004747 [Thecaphora frezii]
MPSTKRKTSSGDSTRPSSKKGKTTPTPNTDASLPLGKALASTSKKTRDLAIRSLSSFLSSPRPTPLATTELDKLWKGVFYCFWMSDKPLIQQDLADRLAGLCLVFPNNPTQVEGEGEPKVGMSGKARQGLEFWAAFWRTMQREWSGVDKHRINKFLLLMRRFVAAAFRLLAKEGWEREAVERFVELMVRPGGGPLAVNDAKLPVSIPYHVSDIYLEELEKAVTWSQEQSASEEEEKEEEDVALVPVTTLLSPFIQGAAKAESKVTYNKIMEAVLVPFLEDTVRAEAHLQEEEEEEKEEEEEEEEKVTQPAAAEEDDDNEDEEAEEEEAASDASSDFASFDDTEGGGEDEVQYPMLLALAEPVSPPSDQQEEAEEGPLALRKAVYRLLFEAASQPEANHSRRRAIYQFWKEEQDRINEASPEETAVQKGAA